MTEAKGISALIRARVIWRQWKKEPVVPAVLVLILALGVAVFLAVRLANRAAVTGFSLFTESISGDSDLLVRPRAGKFHENELSSLRVALGSTPASVFPILETTAAASPTSGSRIFRVIGTDFVALPNAFFLTESESKSENASPAIPFSQTDFSNSLGKSDQVFVGREFAEDFGKNTGDPISIYVEGKKIEVTIAGLLQSNPLRPAIPKNLIVLDLPGAQKLTGNRGIISRLEVRIPPGPDFEKNLLSAKTILTHWSGDKFVVETPGERKKSATRMSAAFRLNLTILSTLALVVGAYLILQAMEASVVKRRAEISILRCLGVTPKQIHRVWLGESITLGVLGLC